MSPSSISQIIPGDRVFHPTIDGILICPSGTVRGNNGQCIEADFLTPLYTRKNVNNLNFSEIIALREAVRVMKERSSKNPKDKSGWTYQANIHGCSLGASNDSDACSDELFNTCQHGNFFFLSWHRMYLYYFEKVLREASGRSDIALPYWDYTHPESENRQIPAIFREPTYKDLFHPSRTPNPLYDSTRTMKSGSDLLPCSTVNPNDQELFATKFLSIGNNRGFGGGSVNSTTHSGLARGTLESNVHDLVHTEIGGNMGNVPPAAKDPIFWLHHANIDRLWDVWVQQEDDGLNPSDQGWLSKAFKFYDVDKKATVELTGAQVVGAASQLRYIYESLDVSDNRSFTDSIDCRAERVSDLESLLSSSFRSESLENEVFGAPITLRTELESSESNLLRVLEDKDLDSHSIVLTLEGIRYDDEADIYHDIYLSLPDSKPSDPDDLRSYFVGHLGLFSFPQGGNRSFNISDIVQKLQTRGVVIDPKEISLTFIPIGVKGAASFEASFPLVQFRKISITVESLE